MYRGASSCQKHTYPSSGPTAVSSVSSRPGLAPLLDTFACRHQLVSACCCYHLQLLTCRGSSSGAKQRMAVCLVGKEDGHLGWLGGRSARLHCTGAGDTFRLPRQPLMYSVYGKSPRCCTDGARNAGDFRAIAVMEHSAPLKKPSNPSCCPLSICVQKGVSL